ncbi:hypothetical protein ACT6QH_08505 [Xanthobacter sp. TB0139]|uniref:hypothetical protein n=1 Tax=Xanthobacter sp. TB0139 TaxID=3459178 RepID=UPI00403968C9
MRHLIAKTCRFQVGGKWPAGRGCGRGCGRAIAMGGVLSMGLVCLGVSIASPAQAQGQQAGFLFATPPSTDANRVYGVNRLTGEMSACQFERPQGSDLGVTRCFPLGEGAGAQKPGDYGLVATNYGGETGIFRVNHSSGEMSICYVHDFLNASGDVESRLQCTPQAR